ncbi:hypothetical protein ACSCB1_03425 [Streptomyces europaeiscabiei]|uniref:Integral membrane protein n=1 Tax=Streptomyces europaeiscabiei TaxID=146819 RepID=A0ABU4NXZ9_9ACTN|nr:hypothetical protein [Streptomyces europaeiscabiei]MDX3549681.1 hypothetical protein [Streptomyces europaeiscabiei]MDX3558968.1 hypothetical protein [Streptomyces europaeiscabiei]MDX3706992.1 hypothetical protein [Streptomyces europaeiscabiei]
MAPTGDAAPRPGSQSRGVPTGGPIRSLLLGTYFPAIPKAGAIGPVLGGQYPFHIAVLALAGTLLGVTAWRSGPLRWGRLLTTVMTGLQS